LGIGRDPGTAVAWTAAAVVALALVCAASGCTAESSTPAAASGEPLSAPELGWVREYSDWTLDVYDEEFDSPPGRELVEECRERLDEVGPPPTDRLEPAWERSAAVCPLLSRAGSVRRAKDVVEDADDLVLPFFIDSRELPLRAERTVESRADPRLAGIASKEAEIAQEVRCWSDTDWRRVVREDNAWEVESDDPDELYGWQDGDTDRIHMRLGQCNLLHRIGPEDVLSWDRDDQVEAADSVATFVHEIQHLVMPDADEGEVECAAAAELSRFARRLGATSAEAARLARLYVTDLREELDDEYRADCDDAG
jgi:hypothetical protein